MFPLVVDVTVCELKLTGVVLTVTETPVAGGTEFPTVFLAITYKV
jgi:hypothetical protein